MISYLTNKNEVRWVFAPGGSTPIILTSVTRFIPCDLDVNWTLCNARSDHKSESARNGWAFIDRKSIERINPAYARRLGTHRFIPITLSNRPKLSVGRRNRSLPSVSFRIQL